MNHNDYMKEWNKKHPDYYKEYRKQYYKKHKERIDKQNTDWAKNNREKSNEIKRNYRKSQKGKIQSAKERKIYKKQIQARQMLNNLLRYHNIKEDCAICGITDTEAHHENYDEPFIIIWLCKEHHLKGDLK